jgi:hypothetical protein
MRPGTVRAAAETPAWETTLLGGRTWDGIWRFNAALRHASDTSLYPYVLGVSILSAQAGPRGHHGAAEADTEEKVTAVVAGRAVLFSVRTSRDRQDFMFYTGSPDWTATLESQLRAATGTGIPVVNCYPDPRWSAYRYQYSRRENGIFLKIVALMMLSLTSLLLWLMVNVAYGQAWGGGELAVLVILIAALALLRRYARWSTEHPALRLGARAVAVSAVLFPLLTLTRVPAWIALVTSLLAGAALVAGVRVARSSTGRAVARRAYGGAVRSFGARVPRRRTVIRLGSRHPRQRRARWSCGLITSRRLGAVGGRVSAGYANVACWLRRG